MISSNEIPTVFSNCNWQYIVRSMLPQFIHRVGTLVRAEKLKPPERTAATLHFCVLDFHLSVCLCMFSHKEVGVLVLHVHRRHVESLYCCTVHLVDSLNIT